MEFLKIPLDSQVFAVVEDIDLGYHLISLHGSRKSAQTAHKKLLQEQEETEWRISKKDRWSIERFQARELFSHF